MAGNKYDVNGVKIDQGQRSWLDDFGKIITDIPSKIPSSIKQNTNAIVSSSEAIRKQNPEDIVNALKDTARNVARNVKTHPDVYGSFGNELNSKKDTTRNVSNMLSKGKRAVGNAAVLSGIKTSPSKTMGFLDQGANLLEAGKTRLPEHVLELDEDERDDIGSLYSNFSGTVANNLPLVVDRTKQGQEMQERDRTRWFQEIQERLSNAANDLEPNYERDNQLTDLEWYEISKDLGFEDAEKLKASVNDWKNRRADMRDKRSKQYPYKGRFISNAPSGAASSITKESPFGYTTPYDEQQIYDSYFNLIDSQDKSFDGYPSWVTKRSAFNDVWNQIVENQDIWDGKDKPEKKHDIIRNDLFTPFGAATPMQTADQYEEAQKNASEWWDSPVMDMSSIDDGSDPSSRTSQYMTGKQYKKYIALGVGGDRPPHTIIDNGIYNKEVEASQYDFVPYLPAGDVESKAKWIGDSTGSGLANLYKRFESLRDALTTFEITDPLTNKTVDGDDFINSYNSWYSNYGNKGKNIYKDQETGKWYMEGNDDEEVSIDDYDAPLTYAKLNEDGSLEHMPDSAKSIEFKTVFPDGWMTTDEWNDYVDTVSEKTKNGQLTSDEYNQYNQLLNERKSYSNSNPPVYIDFDTGNPDDNWYFDTMDDALNVVTFDNADNGNEYVAAYKRTEPLVLSDGTIIRSDIADKMMNDMDEYADYGFLNMAKPNAYGPFNQEGESIDLAPYTVDMFLQSAPLFFTPTAIPKAIGDMQVQSRGLERGYNPETGVYSLQEDTPTRATSYGGMLGSALLHPSERLLGVGSKGTIRNLIQKKFPSFGSNPLMRPVITGIEEAVEEPVSDNVETLQDTGFHNSWFGNPLYTYEAPVRDENGKTSIERQYTTDKRSAENPETKYDRWTTAQGAQVYGNTTPWDRYLNWLHGVPESLFGGGLLGFLLGGAHLVRPGTYGEYKAYKRNNIDRKTLGYDFGEQTKDLLKEKEVDWSKIDPNYIPPSDRQYKTGPVHGSYYEDSLHKRFAPPTAEELEESWIPVVRKVADRILGKAEDIKDRYQK